eukprot:gnl/Hemi2/28202_TR9310_c0_g1_i1.p1 gnl/Hemi2/28202_TR9310_c0_g1~~gnl/Hemi2/28202_TR9310_c0_g1_i1.p1  ORF type:complete len:590 (+),score=163.54 gnl/Hemi2/28202_TR9310_c0_g1_i1:135-1904(+)
MLHLAGRFVCPNQLIGRTLHTCAVLLKRHTDKPALLLKKSQRRLKARSRSRRDKAQTAALTKREPNQVSDESWREMGLEERKQELVDQQRDLINRHVEGLLAVTTSALRDPTKTELRMEFLIADSDLGRHFANGKPRTTSNYNRLLHVQALQGKPHEFLATLTSMKEADRLEYDSYTFTHMFTLCATIANPDLIKPWHKLMMDNAAVFKPTIHTFGSLVQAYVSCGLLNNAFLVLDDMRDLGVKVNEVLVTTLLMGCVRQNQALRAWRAWQHFVTGGKIVPDQITYTVMILACAKRFEAERACQMFNQLKMTLGGQPPNQMVYDAVIHACARRFDQHLLTFQYFEQMKGEGYLPTLKSYNNALLSCSKVGNVPMAIKIYEAMKRDASVTVNELTWRNMLNTLAHAQQRSSPVQQNEFAQQADVYLKIMLESGIKPKTPTLNAYMSVFALARRVKPAMEVYNNMFKNHGLEPNRITHKILLELFSKTKRFDLMNRTWDHMKVEGGVTFREVVVVVHGCLKMKEVDRAVDVLREAKEELDVHVPSRFLILLSRVVRQRSPELAKELAHVCPPPIALKKDRRRIAAAEQPWQ